MSARSDPSCANPQRWALRRSVRRSLPAPSHPSAVSVGRRQSPPRPLLLPCRGAPVTTSLTSSAPQVKASVRVAVGRLVSTRFITRRPPRSQSFCARTTWVLSKSPFNRCFYFAVSSLVNALELFLTLDCLLCRTTRCWRRPLRGIAGAQARVGKHYEEGL